MTTFATFATLRHFQPANLAVDLRSGVSAGQTAYIPSPLQVAKVRGVFAGQAQFAIRHLLRGGELANLVPASPPGEPNRRSHPDSTPLTARDVTAGRDGSLLPSEHPEQLDPPTTRKEPATMAILILVLRDGSANLLDNVDPDEMAKCIRDYTSGKEFEWVTIGKNGNIFRWPTHMIAEVRFSR